MSTTDNIRFIAIDDDPVNNMICKLTIEMVANKPEIVTFTNPSQGFDYIMNEYAAKLNQKQSVLLLDINMPVMSGWEFLERFDNLKDDVKKLFKIFILSSSVDPRDKQRSYANKNVTAFMVKPLVKDNVVEIMDS
ncbi:MAG TPA: response regulator [Cyclobacteriaceae bacterium]|nr:response regulator [Cyclobacteriaceae bacterium]